MNQLGYPNVKLRKYWYWLPTAALVLGIISCSSDSTLSGPRKLSISILHDSDKTIAHWLTSAITPFHAQLQSSNPSHEITVQLIQESSTQSVEDLASGRVKADAVLLPHADLSSIINDQIHQLGAPLSNCKDIIGSPYVAAIPRKQAPILSKLLGRRIETSLSNSVPVTLAELGNLLRNSRFGYTNPRRSIRGQLSSLLAFSAIAPEYFSSELSWDQAAKRFLSIQKQLEWYAPSDTQLLSRLSRQNAKGLSANNDTLSLGIFSSRQLDPNSDAYKSLLTITLSDQTIWEIHSLCISEADWVVPLKISILQRLQGFLSSANMIERAQGLGFTPIPEDRALSPTAISFSTSKHELSQQAISEIEKPMSLSLAIDTSASMKPESLARAGDFALNILRRDRKLNETNILRFSAEVVSIKDGESPAMETGAKLANLTPGGGSAVYDAIAKQYEILGKVPVGDKRRVAIIITDGHDKNSTRSLEDLVSLIGDDNKGMISLHIVLLATETSDAVTYQRIANAAGGSLYETPSERLSELLGEIQASI